jgi:hydrogenase expression/formation protein HypC
MCLAIPGLVTEILRDSGLRTGLVDFGGVRRNVCLEYLPETQIGDFVLVHVGFAISLIDKEEAARSIAMLKESGELDAELNGTNT